MALTSRRAARDQISLAASIVLAQPGAEAFRRDGERCQYIAARALQCKAKAARVLHLSLRGASLFGWESAPSTILSVPDPSYPESAVRLRTSATVPCHKAGVQIVPQRSQGLASGRIGFRGLQCLVVRPPPGLVLRGLSEPGSLTKYSFWRLAFEREFGRAQSSRSSCHQPGPVQRPSQNGPSRGPNRHSRKCGWPPKRRTSPRYRTNSCRAYRVCERVRSRVRCQAS